ncbi:glycine dehydrogenase subunit 1 [Sulfobacillus thermosulfidooxidans DSM 9293]|uniref:Probable glycine dehydrogenase (decarboxylating) subunit 1 n=2 Tax=Sulfobacillus thermosulfidooxidans TaxID=28034 RepID=A0A1W1WJ23_SULTA|nr:aminomethyl-transferring glycine dehydrogenase subunit GcvPA [Sulfobacillus thermosulfidooxidans]PSR29233.1 MAG: aminomethyl-transferring glycine dehydrogenase subunit GcvPA [Sulfobacillus thermosulfidooxidans]SMC06149.1 glycine dehydrogenase subunit 1 [Sulfobacillus thermosulfidooxidans DSM 9293]
MRYIPHTDDDKQAMLQALGYTSIDPLFDDIPEAARLGRLLNLPPALSELELQQHMAQLAAENQNVQQLTSFLGAGFYDRFIPAAIGQLAERGEFLTAYTPYQPELSQGTLAAIFEFQTMIAGLCGMYAAQASMYDGASAVGEAALLALAQTGREYLVVSRYVHADSLAVVRTYAHARGAKVMVVDSLEALEKTLATHPVAGVIWQYPDILGHFRSLPDAISLAHQYGALAIVSSDPVALALLKPPGEWGADVVVGEGQPLGNHLNYGGPTFGFFTVTEKLVRRMPGRLVGQTVDHHGNRGFVLTLQAREQHIRREKATSNICSNHSLNALQATIYMALLGPHGLKQVAELSMHKAHYLAQQLESIGILRTNPDEPFLYEFVVKVPGPVSALNQHLLTKGILGGFDLGQWDPAFEGLWQIAVTEKRTQQELDGLVEEVKRWMSR